MLSKSIENVWRVLEHKKLVHAFPHGDVLLFSGSFALIMHAFATQPEHLRPLNRSALKALVSAPLHSNLELSNQLGQKRVKRA
jgi:hypothetical protein